MSTLIHPDGADPETYRGLPAIYEFVNADGEWCRYNCGQAAACSFLTQRGVFPDLPDPEAARAVMTAVEAANPPDNVFGWFGTSRRRVERICLTHGVEVTPVAGEDELRATLAAGRPVMVMVGTEGPRIWKWHAPAGHWMVAYGFDDRQVFLTNNSAPGMPWDEFRRRWAALAPRFISMRNVGLTVA